MRIGIDVGGTNTDVVAIDGVRVLHADKVATTANVTDGIAAALRSILALGAGDDLATRVRAVMIGTTHFTNAFVQGRDLAPTAVVRLCGPASRAIPPLTAWPAPLRAALRTGTWYCGGGYEVDGREITPVDPGELRRVAAEIAADGLEAIALSGLSSPMNPEQEQLAAEVLAAELPGVRISSSHEIGRLGLVERENATLINASLSRVAHEVFAGFEEAVRAAGLHVPIYLTQNDGTVMSVEHARRYPVSTFSSGPTNSMRGAALLSGLEDCAVVDIGGTTSDVGILRRGFPTESGTEIEVGGVRTNFRMPDTISIGIGGGSRVATGETLAVGPVSVGYEIRSRALVFGGTELTATDLAVAGGRGEVGDSSLVREVPARHVRAGLAAIDAAIAEAVDRMKLTAGAIPVVVVGGGSLLLGETLDGALELVRPERLAVANAVGAALADVGGEVDRVVHLRGADRREAIASAEDEARERAAASGARAGTIRILDVETTPLAYLAGDAVRIRVRAVGELELREEAHAAHHAG